MVRVAVKKNGHRPQRSRRLKVATELAHRHFDLDQGVEQIYPPRKEGAESRGKIPKQQKGEFGQLIQLAGMLDPLIESLASLKDGVPNSEDPWQEKDARISIPAEYDFQAFAALPAPDGIKLVKALKKATPQIITFHER